MKKIALLTLTLFAGMAAHGPVFGQTSEETSVSPTSERLELWRGLQKGMSPEEAIAVVLTFDGVKKAKFKGSEALGYLDVDTKFEFSVAGRRSSIRPIFKGMKLWAVEISLGTEGKCIAGAAEAFNLSHELLERNYTFKGGKAQVSDGELSPLMRQAAINAIEDKPTQDLHTFSSFYLSDQGVIIIKSLTVVGNRPTNDAFLNKKSRCQDFNYTTGLTKLTYASAADVIDSTKVAEEKREAELESLADDL